MLEGSALAGLTRVNGKSERGDDHLFALQGKYKQVRLAM